MALFEPGTSPSAVGRNIFGVATVLTAFLALSGDARWFAASGALGTVWWAWDFVWGNVLGPLGDWFTGAVTGVADVEEPPDLSVDDNIRLLEGHLSSDGVPRHVQVQSALRLWEIYTLNKKDPAKARGVIERVKTKWPDSPELQRFAEGIEQKKTGA